MGGCQGHSLCSQGTEGKGGFVEYDFRIYLLVTAAIQPAGSGFALALKLGVTPETVYDWRDCKASPSESYLTLIQQVAR